MLSSTLPLFGSQTFGQGIKILVNDYNKASTNFSSLDTALSQLNQDISYSVQECHKVIANNPCHSAYSLKILSDMKKGLHTQQVYVNSIVTNLSPVNATLATIQPSVNQWATSLEQIRSYAVLLPIVAVLLYTIIEVAAACNPLSQMDKCCCFTRSLGRLVGYITLLSLISSACVYLTIGLLSSDYCSAPNQNLLRTLKHYDEVIAPSERILPFATFYTQCNTKSTEIQKLEQYFTQVDDKFLKLTNGLQLWPLFGCPKTNDFLSFQQYVLKAQNIFQKKIFPFRHCTHLQPQYCELMNEGICDPFVLGSIHIAMGQLIMSVFIFLSLFVSFWLTTFSGWKKKRKQPNNNKMFAVNSAAEYDASMVGSCQNVLREPLLLRNQEEKMVSFMEDGRSEEGVENVDVVKRRFKNVYDFIGED